MARRGRKRQLDAESLYWQLILSGVGGVEHGRAAAGTAAPFAVTDLVSTLGNHGFDLAPAGERRSRRPSRPCRPAPGPAGSGDGPGHGGQ